MGSSVERTRLEWSPFMSNDLVGDPILPPPPAVPPAPGHPHREKHHDDARDWVVVHRGREGSKAHAESLAHKLVRAGIEARVEHDDDRRVVLEVRRNRAGDAKRVIGADEVSGDGDSPHRSAEERIEAAERAELRGPFKVATMGWVLILVAVAVLAFLAMYAFR